MKKEVGGSEPSKDVTTLRCPKCGTTITAESSNRAHCPGCGQSTSQNSSDEIAEFHITRSRRRKTETNPE